MFLLRPDLEGTLRAIIVGVLANARDRFPSIANFATSQMSNHLHDLLAAMRGDPRVLADYIAYTKREIALRWRREVGWSGSVFEGYRCSALVTVEAQLSAFRYVLSQGVKENLVDDPREWPGFHCAESLMTGEPMKGYWLNGTDFGKAIHAEKVKKNPRKIRREDYLEPRTFTFNRLPALEDLSDADYRAHVRDLVHEIVLEGRRQRAEKRPLGPAAICAQSPLSSRPVPTQPWFEKRRRLIVWDNPRAPEVKAYLERYWQHQTRFRGASKTWRTADNLAAGEFPEWSFIPGLRSRPIPQMETSTS